MVTGCSTIAYLGPFVTLIFSCFLADYFQIVIVRFNYILYLASEIADFQHHATLKLACMVTILFVLHVTLLISIESVVISLK